MKKFTDDAVYSAKQDLDETNDKYCHEYNGTNGEWTTKPFLALSFNRKIIYCIVRYLQWRTLITLKV